VKNNFDLRQVTAEMLDFVKATHDCVASSLPANQMVPFLTNVEEMMVKLKVGAAEQRSLGIEDLLTRAFETSLRQHPEALHAGSRS